MTWEYWICLYTQTHCAARGLRTNTIAAYGTTLRQFREYIRLRHGDIAPYELTAAQVLMYLQYLRQERDNGDSAVQRQLTILKSFYAAMVAMGHIEPRANPLAHMPKIKAKPRKLPTVLVEEEVKCLLESPPTDIVLGLRDRGILTLLYGTGIRASECATLKEEDVDLIGNTIRVTGKGGHQRVIPLNPKVVEVLVNYRQARGDVRPRSTFFRSRRDKAMSRGAIYERVRKYSRRARIPKNVSPHTLRHTFATHLVKAGESLVTIRDLLGHRSISSTQIYLHVTAEDLRAAAANHPVQRLAPTVEFLLGNVKLPLQYAPQRHPPVKRETG
jgi:site-specific recombinase XerD